MSPAAAVVVAGVTLVDHWRRPDVTGDFELTDDELRVVARYAAESAQDVLPVFEQACPGDPRPRAALDAASAAYLHPIAKSHQVGHILRAAANAARIAELTAGDDPRAGDASLELARRRATNVLVDVLRRYPPAPAGKSRPAALMSALDAALRA